MQILLDKHEHPIMIIAEIKNTSAQSVTATSSEGEGDRRSHLQQSVIQFMIMVMVAMVIDDGCGGTADAGIILSVIIHMYKNKNTPNEPGDDNDSAESSA